MLQRIVILGWGSLIKYPRGLPIRGEWIKDGPVLRIEFSRISRDGRLTLVIDEAHGSEVRTYYAESSRDELEDAICDVRIREGTALENVGYCQKTPEKMRGRSTSVLQIVSAWLAGKDYDAVVWTDLESNYEKKRKTKFSPEDALEYLKSLPRVCREEALEYIRTAPEQTQTLLRMQLANWVGSIE